MNLKKMLPAAMLILLGSMSIANAQFKINTKVVGAGADVVKAATLSDAQVSAMCKDYAKWIDEHNPVAPAGNKYGDRLKKLTSKHTKESGLDLNFKALLVKDVNAFALADGSVRVFAGLMDIMTDDEILGIIGHEVGHVKNKDSKDAMRTAYMSSAARKAAGSQGGAVGALSDSEYGALGEALANAQFSQKQEKAADDNGFEFLKDNKYDVSAMASAFRKLAALSGGSSGKSQIMSSHPDSEKRAERMDKKAKALADKK
ncbi:MAG: M48 family metallopeptidase [Daejeonella sp.]